MDIATIAIVITCITLVLGGGGFYALFVKVGRREKSIEQLEEAQRHTQAKLDNYGELKTDFALVRQALETLSKQWNAAERNISALLAKDSGNEVEITHIQEEVGRLRNSTETIQQEFAAVKAQLERSNNKR